MKSFLISLLALSTFSAFAGSNDQVGILMGAICNTEYEFGQVKIAVYDLKSKSYMIKRLNIVNESLCNSGNALQYNNPLNVVTMSYAGNKTGNRLNFKINSHNIVTDIESVDLKNKESKRMYKKLNSINSNNIKVVDFLIVNLDESLRSKEVIENITSLIDKAQMD